MSAVVADEAGLGFQGYSSSPVCVFVYICVYLCESLTTESPRVLLFSHPGDKMVRPQNYSSVRFGTTIPTCLGPLYDNNNDYPSSHHESDQGGRAEIETVKPVVVELGEVGVKDGEAGDVAPDAVGWQGGGVFWFKGLRRNVGASHLGGKVRTLTYRRGGKHLQPNCL